MKLMRRAVLLIAIFALQAGGAAAAQDVGIGSIEIVDLAPFTVSFRFTHEGTSVQREASGRILLSDRLGQTIEVIPITPFVPTTAGSEVVIAGSRWDFQQAGSYLLQVTLDLGSGALVSNSLAFRILPIRLPLEPKREPEDERLYTVYQKPISWGLLRINAPEAWEISHGSSDVIVAVIDSGIDWSVPQIADSLWTNADEVPGNGMDDDRNGFVDDVHGWDFRDGDAGPLVGSTIHGHGTFVASIIAARPGTYPIVGVAPGVRIMDVRFLDSTNSFKSSDWKAFVRAIEYAVDNGADIINLSIYANGEPPTSFRQALADAHAKGVIVVGIAGNQGRTGVLYPAKYDSVLAVSATGPNDLLASFSNRGPEVAVCAPGEDITSLTKGGRPLTQSGTSFAAPYVSGVLALILSASPGTRGDDAVATLAASCLDLGQKGKDPWYGNGLVDAWSALRSLRRP